MVKKLKERFNLTRSIFRDTLKQKGWLDEEKGNTLAHFLDLLYQINLGVFEIEEVENTIITQLTPEQKRVLSLFDLEQRYFTNYRCRPGRVCT